MLDVSAIFTQTTPTYQRPEDIDFPVSKVRFFLDILWQTVTGKQLTDEQRTTLKQLIDVLNLLDEHKHEPEKELIAAMLPGIAPLLEKMPTLGLTGTHVFTHLVPVYQLYLPNIERLVKDAHPFSLEETLLYYELTIFDHLFLVHLFEQERDVNMIELVLTIKAIILINALVYDYHQHVEGRSISFFTFLMRGGKASEELLPFLTEATNKLKDEVKATVQNEACLQTLEFLSGKLMDTTKAKEQNETANEQKENTALDSAMLPTTPPAVTDQIFNQVTETPVEVPQEKETSMSDAQNPVATPVPTPVPATPPTPTPAPEPTSETPIIANPEPTGTPVGSVPTPPTVIPEPPLSTPPAPPIEPVPSVPSAAVVPPASTPTATPPLAESPTLSHG